MVTLTASSSKQSVVGSGLGSSSERPMRESSASPRKSSEPILCKKVIRSCEYIPGAECQTSKRPPHSLPSRFCDTGAECQTSKRPPQEFNMCAAWSTLPTLLDRHRLCHRLCHMASTGMSPSPACPCIAALLITHLFQAEQRYFQVEGVERIAIT